MFEMSDKEKMLGEIMGAMIKHKVDTVSNELRFNNMDINSSEVVLAFNACFHEFTFNFMKALNLVMNGADAEKMGNINEFISILEGRYLDSEDFRKEIMEE